MDTLISNKVGIVIDSLVGWKRSKAIGPTDVREGTIQVVAPFFVFESEPAGSNKLANGRNQAALAAAACLEARLLMLASRNQGLPDSWAVVLVAISGDTSQICTANFLQDGIHGTQRYEIVPIGTFQLNKKEEYLKFFQACSNMK